MLISYLGFDNLCNMTNGGEGCAGKVISDEMKLRISDKLKSGSHVGMRGLSHSYETKVKMAISSGAKIVTFTNKDGSVFTGFPFELSSKFSISRGHVSELISGKRKTAKGWMVDK